MEEKTILPVATQTTPSVINWNYKDIKDNLSQFLEKYENYVVQEQTLTDDKKTRAELNKISKNIDDFRKVVKVEISKPIKIFEDQCNELSEMVDDVSNKIDSKVKEFETIKKEEKRKEAQEIIKEICKNSELPEEYIKKIEFKENFTNLSITKKQISDDILLQIDTLKNEYKQFLENSEVIKIAIENANKDITTKLFADDYISQLSFRPVSEIVSIISSRVDTIKNEVKKESDVIIQKVEEPKKEEELLTVSLEITGTKTQFNGIKEFLTINKINYKRI